MVGYCELSKLNLPYYNWITGKFSFDDSQYPKIEILVNSVWCLDSQYPTIELLVNSVLMIHNILQLNYW
jgi:hypothetical protein